jgi:hypothetical protein
MAIAPSIRAQAGHRNQYRFVCASEVDRQDLSCVCRKVDARPSLATAAENLRVRRDLPAAPTAGRLEAASQVIGFLLATLHKLQRTTNGLSRP